MPRKSKITAVPIEQPTEQPILKDAVGDDVDEQKTDAQEMTEVLNEVNVVSEPVAVEPAAVEPAAVEPVALPSESSGPKAKAKRASRAKAPEPVAPEAFSRIEVTPALDETVAPKAFSGIEVALLPPESSGPSEPNKDAKASEKVSCPDCGKQMSAKTLKYSHVPNCLVKKQKETHGPPEPPASSPSGVLGTTVTDEMIEQEIEKRMSNRRTERLNKRQKDLEKLVAGAF